jgi:Gnt-I system low-affinity gluconate transporter
MDTILIIAVFAGIALLLLLNISLKIPAFLSLLIASVFTGLIAGLEPIAIINSMKEGMGKTLGFIATVVGLGAIFGAILEHTGGARVLAKWLLLFLGEKQVGTALMLTGFLVSIPVFFDVGFVILYPVIAALQKQSGKSLLLYALPLLGGLAVGHAFIPPTPGPMAVAEILNVSLPHVILAGMAVGVPSAILGGLLYGNYLGKRLHIESSELAPALEIPDKQHPPNVAEVFSILLLPIFLIVCSTFIDSDILKFENQGLKQMLSMICHPFSALIIANILAWTILGLKRGLSKDQLASISTKSFYPVGVIILVTGAGGVYKEVLITTGAGEMMAKSMHASGMSILLFAFLAAAFIRVMQGSATVAMITAAGLVAPLLQHFVLSDFQIALVVISIASGATVLSHLNDSGFWMVKEFLGITERQCLRAWTVASSIIGFSGLLVCFILFKLIE